MSSLSGPRESRPHKAWHSRGYLPHFDSPETVQTVTFRLADSLPRAVIAEIANSVTDRSARRERIDSLIDEGRGSCVLARPEVASIVCKALSHFDGERYRLLAWVFMPKHVHVAIEQIEGFPLGRIVQSWKSFSAKEIGKVLGKAGTIWAPDYFDRYIRDEAHYHAALEYIEQNPVKAGRIARAEDWRFSSAAERRL